MPNHVKNRVEIVGTPEQIRAVLDSISTNHDASPHKSCDGRTTYRKKNDEMSFGWLDENTGMFSRRNMESVHGVPDGYDVLIDPAYVHCPDFNKIIPQPENIFNGDLSEEDRLRCEKDGIPNWYDWNVENWGTKWNSYSCHVESEKIFTFETAWSAPLPIMRQLGKMFPNVTFNYSWADEDTGFNCGHGTIKGDEFFVSRLENNSYDAYMLAFSLWPDIKKCYLIEGENVTHKDCDTCEDCD